MPLEVQTREIERLLIDPLNARIHPPRNLETIRASLRSFGQRRPLVVDQDGIVIAGNGTLEAMRAEGFTHVDVVVFPGDAQQARAYGLIDNRSGELAEWDDNRLANLLRAVNDQLLPDLGWNDDELTKLLTEPMPPGEFPEVDENIDTAYRCPSCGYEWSGKPA